LGNKTLSLRIWHIVVISERKVSIA